MVTFCLSLLFFLTTVSGYHHGHHHVYHHGHHHYHHYHHHHHPRPRPPPWGRFAYPLRPPYFPGYNYLTQYQLYPPANCNCTPSPAIALSASSPPFTLPSYSPLHALPYTPPSTLSAKANNSINYLPVKPDSALQPISPSFVAPNKSEPVNQPSFDPSDNLTPTILPPVN